MLYAFHTHTKPALIGPFTAAGAAMRGVGRDRLAVNACALGEGCAR